MITEICLGSMGLATLVVNTGNLLDSYRRGERGEKWRRAKSGVTGVWNMLMVEAVIATVLIGNAGNIDNWVEGTVKTEPAAIVPILGLMGIGIVCAPAIGLVAGQGTEILAEAVWQKGRTGGNNDQRGGK